MKKFVILAVLAIAGATAGIIACGGSDQPANNPGNTTTTTSSAPADTGAPAASGAASAAPAQ